MKRSILARRTGLRRASRLRARPKRIEHNPARDAWKTRVAGACECGCGVFTIRLERHHVIYEQHLRAEGHEDLLWDLRNSMLLLPAHHRNHHLAAKQIRRARIPAAAVEFAVERFGADIADRYLSRYYAAEETA